MSIPLIADSDLEVRNVFPLARSAVLSSLNIREENLFTDIPTNLLTREECKELVLLICSSVSLTDERSWSSTTVHGNRFMGTIECVSVH